MKYTLLLICCFLIHAPSAASTALSIHKRNSRKSPQCVSSTKTRLSLNLRKDWKMILPGTKWCGDGDIAENYDDLGTSPEVDTCCRSHDNCDEFIPKLSSKHGLTNDGNFTRLGCECDKEFYDCLKEIDSSLANLVGATYFDVLGEDCFDLKPPATCNQYHTRSSSDSIPRCHTYRYKAIEPEVWQWFHAPAWN